MKVFSFYRVDDHGKRELIDVFTLKRIQFEYGDEAREEADKMEVGWAFGPDPNDGVFLRREADINI